MKKFRSKNLLVTGGAGFIGSNFINYIIHKYENLNIYNLDSLTYAGNLENTKDFKHYSRYKFIHGDICDFSLVLDYSINIILMELLILQLSPMLIIQY